MPPVRVGLLGCGNVGSAIVRLLDEHADRIAARAGADLEVTRVVVRDLTRARDVKLAPERFTTDAASVVEGPDIDVIVEVIGGVEPPGTLIRRALEAGKRS